MCHCSNPLALVRFPTGQSIHHCLSNWTTPTSGRFIGSWTAELIAVARGQGCCTLLSGKDLTTSPMPPVGNHWNTSRMHLTWSKRSIRPIQTSRLPEFMRRGLCFIFFLYYGLLNHSLEICF